jgi:replication-associated recombination protein RarA
MKPYFGHEKNVKAVNAHLPSVLLFQGPASVGKWELAEYVREKWKFKNSDTMRIKRLTQDNARAAAKFASERPRGWSKLVIVRLDRKATKGAQNALLKALEEARDATFILIAEEPPLDTVKSRAITYNFGLLSEKNIFDILTVRKNFSEERAGMLAGVARGQVRNALSYLGDQESKVVVMKALDAVQRRDSAALEALAPKWSQEHTDLLIQWCYEALTNKWKLFIPEETNITGTKVPLRILIAVREDLRPRLIVRAALASVLQGT